MDRAVLEQRLAVAEQCMTLSELCVARMRKIITELERGGHNSTGAKKILADFLVTQAALLADCDRLSKRLKASSEGR